MSTGNPGNWGGGHTCPRCNMFVQAGWYHPCPLPWQACPAPPMTITYVQTIYGVCDVCGVALLDPAKHTAWHAKQDRIPA